MDLVLEDGDCVLGIEVNLKDDLLEETKKGQKHT